MSIKKHHAKGCDRSSKNCACPYRLDYRPLGMSGPHKRIQFPTRKEAERYQAETRVKAGRGEYIPPAQVPTFAAVAQQWLREKADRHPATLLGWRAALKHLTALDALRLDQISVTTIEHVRDQLLKKLSAKRIRVILTICAAVFKSAQRRSLTTSNPAALAVRPRDPVVEVSDDHESGALRPGDVLDAIEIARILEHATPGLMRTLFATAAATGMRSEELCALKWSDIEFDASRLFVRRSVSWTRDEGQVGIVRPRFYPTKTKAGARTLPLPAALVSMLRVWKLQAPPSADDLVFGHPLDGSPLRRSQVGHGGLTPACRRAGLRRCSLGIFRHSFASGLLAQGAPITMVQARMGHANAAITLRTYSHFVKSTDNGEADRYAAAFLSAPAQLKVG